MDYLGLFCLGVFVGAIAALGVRYIKGVAEWQKVMIAILPAVLSGVAVAFVDRFKFSPALGCYPLGLTVALMWTYADVAAEHIIKGKSQWEKAVGVLHLAASAVVTVGAVVVVLIPAVLQVNAELNIPTADRVDMLKQERNKALAASQEPAKPPAKATTQASTLADPEPKK